MVPMGANNVNPMIENNLNPVIGNSVRPMSGSLNASNMDSIAASLGVVWVVKSSEWE